MREETTARTNRRWWGVSARWLRLLAEVRAGSLNPCRTHSCASNYLCQAETIARPTALLFPSPNCTRYRAKRGEIPVLFHALRIGPDAFSAIAEGKITPLM